ncbi:MAG: acetoacetate decarboxylase family protein [Deltaproteobacteria bacterium]|nr:acetoacetate decarboxylase family protein [Deltaproteobacteria bacterium]
MQRDPSVVNQDPSARRFDIEGERLGYPTRFQDGCAATGLFLVKSRVANELIADSGFTVAQVAPGRAVLTLNCVHYTDTDCGAYDEIAMAFFVEESSRRARVPYVGAILDIMRGQCPSYTWNIQVTSALSRDAGLLMWGFPKTIEEIDYQRSEEDATFRLRRDGQEVLRYSLRVQGEQQPAPLTSPVYSVFEGAQQVSYLNQEYREVGYQPGGGRLELGGHALAQQLRTLGLPRRPLIASWMGHLCFSMSAPQKL